jgi:hypothetical protein
LELITWVVRTCDVHCNRCVVLPDLNSHSFTG